MNADHIIICHNANLNEYKKSMLYKSQCNKREINNIDNLPKTCIT